MNLIVPTNGEEPFGEEDRRTVHFYRTFWEGRYGQWKAVVNLPHPDDDPKYVEIMKQLDFDETHRRFDAAADDWVIDLTSLNEVVSHLSDRGVEVSVNLEVAKDFEEKEGVFLPERR